MHRPDQCDCKAGGTWGATGVMPEGHHLKFMPGGFYLAHGPARQEDVDHLARITRECYDRAVHNATLRYDEQMAAINRIKVKPRKEVT
jgi:hypothetical protein